MNFKLGNWFTQVLEWFTDGRMFKNSKKRGLYSVDCKNFVSVK